MWLASLRRLVAGYSRSPKSKKVRPQRRRIIPRLDHLEDRIVPSTITMPTVAAGDVTTLVNDLNTATADTNNSYVINLTSSTTNPYKTGINNPGNGFGSNALPIITTGANITINGNGATINGQLLARLMEVSAGATLTLQNLTLTGGIASGSTAEGGAIYNSGTLNMTSVVVGGNQAIGGSGQNGEGGGIYSNGGILTLKNDIIGRKASVSENFVAGTAKSSAKGATNSAIGGAGGSGQGAGIYVSGGTVRISYATIAGNKASGGSNGNAQGGGIYANGSNLTLVSDFIGLKTSVNFNNNHTQLLSASSIGGRNSAIGGSSGSGQGGGLYVSGGTVKVTNGTIIANFANGTFGAAGGAGGTAQGGGIFANSTMLTLTGASLSGNGAHAGSGGFGSATNHLFTGGAGGMAQGGGIYATSTNLTVTGGSVSANSANPGNGGNGAQGTSQNANGGAGGTSGIGQGGGFYVKGGSLTLSNAASVTSNSVASSNGGTGGASFKTVGFFGSEAFGVGGAGGAGNIAEGGGVFATNAKIQISGGVTINSNSANGGGGGIAGRGKTGGQGGSGGQAGGGGLFVQGGTVSITGSNTAINNNHVFAGAGVTGGSGLAAGAGGIGGDAYGGGMYALGNSVTLSNGLAIESNGVTAGAGGSGHAGILGTTNPGGNGGSGAVGGTAIGGGAYLAGVGTSLSINSDLTNPATVSIVGNIVSGGAGGGGGNGGLGTPGGNGGNAAAGGIAEGGGLAFNGSGNTTPPAITITAAQINGNSVQGGNGGNGGNGGSGTFGGAAGGNGGLGAAGASAQGGGLYVNDAALSLTNTTLSQNVLQGGQGGQGGSGGTALGHLSGTQTSLGGNGGNGNNGSNGAAAQGGGLYVNASTVTLNTVTLSSNSVSGGQGGGGGFGGAAGSGFAANVSGPYPQASHGGNGGNAGNAAAAQGGGVFATGASTITALNTAVTGNKVYSGQGGAGGGGGKGASEVHHGGNGGIGGNGGNAGSGQGGGVYINAGSFSLVNSTVATNTVTGENGGNGGAGGFGGQGVEATFGDSGGNGGKGGDAGAAAAVSGGGVFSTGSTLNLVNATIANNALKDGSGGAGGAGGDGKQGFKGTQNDGAGGNGGNGGNGASGQGGGLYASGGSLSLINGTVLYNAITGGSPGAGGSGGQGVTFTNVATGQKTQYSPNGTAGKTGTTPVPGDQGGGLYVGASAVTATIENTIVALDTSATDADLSGTFSSSDADFIGDGTGSNLTDGTNGDIIGHYPASQVSSFFGTLANNGGPTQTIAPTSASPTFGNGDPTAAAAIANAEGVASGNNATDQRGLTRVINGSIDIGSIQEQLVLDGSPSVTSVQTGGTITYTLTVTNSESSPVSVTLTDKLDPNTTYQSSSGTSWTITPPASGPGGTLTATLASLAANSSATLTITVTVASNAPSNYTIVNTASIAPTGNSGTGARTVLMDTQTQGATNITSDVRVIRSPVLHDRDDGPNAYVQGALLINNSGMTLTGPIALVLVGLPSDVTLTNASGYYNGNPYVNIVAAGQTWAAGWWHFLITILEFSTTNRADIKYTPEILQGI